MTYILTPPAKFERKASNQTLALLSLNERRAQAHIFCNTRLGVWATSSMHLSPRRRGKLDRKKDLVRCYAPLIYHSPNKQTTHITVTALHFVGDTPYWFIVIDLTITTT